MTAGADDRVERLVAVLTRLASGDLAARGDLTGVEDEINAAIAGVNMLAEELEASEVRHQALLLGLEQKVAERTGELDRLARRYERILVGVAEGIYGTDPQGRIDFVNPAAARMLGRSAEDLIGKDAHQEFHVSSPPAASSPEDGCHVDAALMGGEAVRLSDVHYRGAGGRIFPVEIIASPIHDVAGITGAVVAFSDITERRELERLKDEFISVVSHELRTPLTSIRGSLALIAGGAVGVLPKEAQRMLRIAVDNSERLTRLVNDILNLERIGSGGVPMEFSIARSSDLVSATLAQLQPVADAAGVELVTEEVAGSVRADTERVVQALTNLVSNAIKFSPRGGHVEVGAVVEGAHVTFRIGDQGRGVPQDKAAVIFERFQQVDSSDARDKGGTGLGLAITKSIIERHGGRIWVESALGTGSTFFFTLPVAQEQSGIDVSSRDAVAVALRRNVLVCDDDPDILEMLGVLLREQGHSVIPVARGLDAIDSAVAEHPDVILLDLRMPGLTGWDTVSELQRRPETNRIPIVIMSGLSPSVDRTLAAQTDGWLTKPFDEAHMNEALNSALSRGVARATVLIVEDDPDLANLLITMLERRGLHAMHAATEPEAVARCRESDPAVIVLDLHLPEGDGYGVIEALRGDDRLSRVPVIVYTAHDLDTRSRDRLRLGEMVFLTKGVDTPQELERRVVDLTDRVREQRAASSS